MADHRRPRCATPTSIPTVFSPFAHGTSAAYKGIYALLMQRGGREFLTDVPISFQTYEEEKIDIHHIFPKAWCKKQDIEHKRMDCVVNKTALSARTNRIIGGVAPSTYLLALEKRGNVFTAAMDAILSTHLILPEALRENNFEEFFEARHKALLDLITTAMGKAPAVLPKRPSRLEIRLTTRTTRTMRWRLARPREYQEARCVKFPSVQGLCPSRYAPL